MSTMCPRCRRISFHAENVGTRSAEVCDSCGFARVGVSPEGEPAYECGGFGQIAYTDKRTRRKVVMPFDMPMTRNGAKRAFLSFFRQRTDVSAEKRELNWFDCERRVLARYDETKKTWKEEPGVKDALCDDPIKRWEDAYFIETTDETKFLDEVDEMMLETMWEPDIESNSLRLVAIPSLIEAAQVSTKYGLDPERTYANAEDGTKLVLAHNGRYFNISNISRSTLYETAKLTGSALGRMSPSMLAEVLNCGLTVARGQTLLLIRWGKIMAMHSSGSYCIMPMDVLIETTKRALTRYGEVKFEKGYQSNQYTMAIWSLPDAQDKLLDAYQQALAGTASHAHAINFMPVVRFASSDTKTSAVNLRPMFMKPNGVCFSLTEGISVKHEQKSEQLYGLDLYEQQAGTVFAKFLDSMELLKQMATTEIFNPVNCVVGLFNWINKGSKAVIPRKYADSVRTEIERYAINSPVMSMHDIYLSMVECIGLAQENDASQATINNMDEALTKVLTADWKAFDVGGFVVWGDKQPV